MVGATDSRVRAIVSAHIEELVRPGSDARASTLIKKP